MYFDLRFWVNFVSSFDAICRQGSYSKSQLMNAHVLHRTYKTYCIGNIFSFRIRLCLQAWTYKVDIVNRRFPNFFEFTKLYYEDKAI